MSATNHNQENFTNNSDLKSGSEEQPIIIETEVELSPEETSQPIKKTKRRSWGIRAKATLLAMAIGTLPVMAVGGIAYYVASKSIYQQLETFEITNVTELQDKIHVYMGDRFGDIQAMAGLDIFTHPQWRETAILS